MMNFRSLLLLLALVPLAQGTKESNFVDLTGTSDNSICDDHSSTSNEFAAAAPSPTETAAPTNAFDATVNDAAIAAALQQQENNEFNYNTTTIAAAVTSAIANTAGAAHSAEAAIATSNDFAAAAPTPTGIAHQSLRPLASQEDIETQMATLRELGLRGSENTVRHLIELSELMVVMYDDFVTEWDQFLIELTNLSENELFVIQWGVGKINVKRAPVFRSTEKELPVFLEFLRENGGNMILNYINYYAETILPSMGMRISNVWITYYRSKESLDQEEMTAHTLSGPVLKYGEMIFHPDTYLGEVCMRITTTIGEHKDSKQRKRFKMRKKNDTHFTEDSFEARNGVVVMLGEYGSGSNGSGFEHSVENAARTATITIEAVPMDNNQPLQPWEGENDKEEEEGDESTPKGNLKDDNNYL